jgi:glutamate carboxypeptidase
LYARLCDSRPQVNLESPISQPEKIKMVRSRSTLPFLPFLPFAAIVLAVSLASQSHAAPVEPVLSLAQQQKAPLLDTLKDLVAIESGTGDREGLDKISELVAGRLRALGGKVEFVEPGADTYRMFDTPDKVGRMVLARFAGTGSKKILLIAHMDTVYLRGMGAQQPFRIDGNRAYGLGIADDKAGIATILHTVAVLQALNFHDYGELTVLINADEERSSPGSRSMLTRLGSENDAVFSFEGSPVSLDQLALTTAGVAAVTLNIHGKASHAGSAPENGRNALYEMAHQILQMRDLSDPATGLKMNWTMASAGSNRNVIPAEATASADIRVLRIADYDGIEQKVRERIKNQLIPDTRVEMSFERRRPPLQLTPAAEALARHAQQVYAELGKELAFSTLAAGGGTDAAFASLQARGPVLERFGIQGFGAHSNNAEYISIDSIAPRIYLATRMIMDVSQARDH